MKINVPGTNKFFYLRLSCQFVDADNAVVGLHSGYNHNTPSFTFLDYDSLDYSVVEKEFSEIVTKNGWRRGIILESSPGKWWALSFTPQRFEKALAIAEGSSEDKNHAALMRVKGFSTIRTTLKKGGFVPRVVKVIENKEGTEFYNYLAEKEHLHRLELMQPVKDKEGFIPKVGED